MQIAMIYVTSILVMCNLKVTEHQPLILSISQSLF